MSMAAGDPYLTQQWQTVQLALKEQYGQNIFQSWFQGIELAEINENTLVLNVDNRFVRDWIVTHYAARIEQLWQTHNPNIQSVEFVVKRSSAGVTRSIRPIPPKNSVNHELNTPSLPTQTGYQAPFHSSYENSKSKKNVFEDLSRSDGPNPMDQFEEGLELDVRYTFENFVVGKPNELAHAAARRVSEASQVSFNPLFLYGGVGLGKTHLMHAIAWHIRQSHPQRRVLYMSAEKFMYRFIKALRFKDTMAFKEQFRSVDVLMIDDVQFISGKDSTQEEFFHTFNALVDQNRQIIVSADKSPSDLEGMEERLKSRLGWGLVADIHPTNYELRLGILQAKSDQIQAKVPQKVLELLSSKITSNVRELEGALTRIVAHAELIGRELTLEMTLDILRDLFRANDKRLTIEDIQKRVADHFGIRLADMHSPKRVRTIALPRHVAMYLAKHMTQYSLPEIGRRFGGRDHTTVLHAVQKIEELRTTDKTLEEDIVLLQRALNN